MSQQKLITVIIPTYNRGNFIERAINSILKQTYKNWELIIVDDISEDETIQLVKDRYGADHRIRILIRPSNREKGANACRNIGIEHANGDFVAFLDSDDQWTENHLKRKLDCLIFNEADGVFSGNIIHKDDRIIPRIIPEYKGNNNIGNYNFENRTAIISTPTFVCKKDACLKIKFDEKLHKYQDLDFAIRFDQSYKLISEPTPTLNVFSESKNRISESIDHNSTEYFLNKHSAKLSSDALGNFYVILAKQTFLKEGKSENYRSYREKIFSISRMKYFNSYLPIIEIPKLGHSIYYIAHYINLKYRILSAEFFSARSGRSD